VSPSHSLFGLRQGVLRRCCTSCTNVSLQMTSPAMHDRPMAAAAVERRAAARAVRQGWKSNSVIIILFFLLALLALLAGARLPAGQPGPRGPLPRARGRARTGRRGRGCRTRGTCPARSARWPGSACGTRWGRGGAPPARPEWHVALPRHPEAPWQPGAMLAWHTRLRRAPAAAPSHPAWHATLSAVPPPSA
jgi:hypothetical protein